ncbi:S1 family peptidase [Actinoallomurus sp. NPDC050550]|uniref:S1 family peptidase n=1 Tax=Actinoallomurus sp. NPDC050550 TaxID=3154937 RepID=UPI003406D526
MFHPPARRIGLTVTAAGLLALSAAPAAHATAPANAASPSAVASRLAQRLGYRSAGSYVEHSSKKLIVDVTNNSDARTVQAAGATPRIVTRSGAQLRQAKKELDDIAVPGTARVIDPHTDQVVLSVDSTVAGARLAKVQQAVKKLGSSVRVRQIKGRFRPLISGGDAIWGSGYRCSLGFNVTDGSGNAYFITAGHCGNVVSTWYADQGSTQQIATTQDSRFPGTDYSIAAYVGGVSHPSEVDLYDGTAQPITGAADATVGESVQRSGSTTGVYGGTVTGVNASVTYSEGTVNGLIDTDVCAEPGDSGGALFDGSTALGLTSGGSGDCTSGGETFFQPVPPVLNAYGVSIG